jgi:hypothetical protein
MYLTTVKRMVSGLKSEDYSERSSELGLPTLEEQWQFCVAQGA